MSQEKYFTPEEKARERFQEKLEERLKLWFSIIEDSNLNDKNKSRFKDIVSMPFNAVKHGNVGRFLEHIPEELYQAVVYSYQTDETLAVYKNITADIEQFEKELYL